MSSAICFNLDQSKILSSGNGLNGTQSIHVYLTHPYVKGLTLYQTTKFRTG